uniref:Uncharacterized protein n=1 Tax=Plectus sambesii TaxID=2011161 RepID=A0A914X2V5_9BILA
MQEFRINFFLAVSAFSVILATLPQLLFWAGGLGLFVFPNGGRMLAGGAMVMLQDHNTQIFFFEARADVQEMTWSEGEGEFD